MTSWGGAWNVQTMAGTIILHCKIPSPLKCLAIIGSVQNLLSEEVGVLRYASM